MLERRDLLQNFGHFTLLGDQQVDEWSDLFPTCLDCLPDRCCLGLVLLEDSKPANVCNSSFHRFGDVWGEVGKANNTRCAVENASDFLPEMTVRSRS
jgi:hypothetical protein